jgi:ATP-dependent RNA helicase DDX52/ROK1
MEAFRLLSRSTNLKPAKISKQEEKALHVPSGGQSHAQTSAISEAMTFVSTTTLAGKKRKRDASQTVQTAAATSTLNAFQTLNVASNSDGEAYRVSGLEVSSQEASKVDGLQVAEPMSPDECRSIFKSHKVKISALTRHPVGSASGTENSAHMARVKRKVSKVEPLSRKQQKEASRLYTQPLTSFTLLKSFYGASGTLCNNLREQGYSTPTEVQLATIPLLLDPTVAGLHLPPDHRSIDLLSVAPTGSGKTLAFLIPLINHLVHQHHQSTKSGSSRHVSALVLAPTKELVGQIVNEGRKLSRNTGVSITAMRKGMSIAVQGEGTILGDNDERVDMIRAVDGASVVKADILVTTPLLLANTISEDKGDLSSVRYFILDEADVLLDPLFRDQTVAVWNACTNPNLRVSLWSATIGSNIEELVVGLIDERRTRLAIESQCPLLRCVIGLKDSVLPSISHKLIYAATEPGKLLGLRQLLHPSSSTASEDPSSPPLRPPFLVFTQTIERASALHAELLYDIPIEAGGSTRIAVLHSDLSDLKRSEIMSRFRKGQIWVLITTDLLSRGVDFRGVNGVVNYDIPTSSAAYVHRVGRTGRAGREGGRAITFYTRDDIKYVKGIANAIAASEKASSSTKAAGGEHSGIQPWLLNALPDISKKDRRELKKRGVAVRRRVRDGEGDKEVRAKRASRISTKSGYERRRENNLKGAINAGQQHRHEDDSAAAAENDESDAWSGFDG